MQTNKQGISIDYSSNKNIDNTFQKYFEAKKALQSQKSNLSLSNPQLSYDSDALFNSRIIQKQISRDQKKYATNDNINQNYTSQSDLIREMNFLKKKYQSIIENPQVNREKQSSIDALKKKYLGTVLQNSDDLNKQIQTPQQYEQAYQQKMREISDFLNLPQQPQFQTANTAHSTNYINSIKNSNGKGYTSQQLFSQSKYQSNQSLKNQETKITKFQQHSKREYEPISAHTSLLTASSFDHQSKLFGYPDYAYNQFKIDMLSQGLSVSKLSKQQFQLIQHQKRVREKNQFKLWRDCRKVKNQLNEDSKSVRVENSRLNNKSQIYNQEKQKIDQKQNQKQQFNDQKSQKLNDISEKLASRSCNQQVSAQNFRVASKTTESFKRKIMKDDDLKSSNINQSFQSKSIKRWDKSPIVKKNFYHQHLKKQYKPKLPFRNKENEVISQNNQKNNPQNSQSQNKKTHAFLTRLKPQLFQNFMDNYRNSNSISQKNNNDWMQLNITQKAQKNKIQDLQVKVDLNNRENQKVKFYQEDIKSQRQKSLNQKQMDQAVTNLIPQQLKNSQSQIMKKPVKLQKKSYYSLSDNDNNYDKNKNHKRNRSSNNTIQRDKQAKIQAHDQISVQQKKQFGLPFQQMDIITEKLKKFEIDQQKRLKNLQNFDFNKTQVINQINSNRIYPLVESIKTNESKSNQIITPTYQNQKNRNSYHQISEISCIKDQQVQDYLLKDLNKSRNKLGKKIRRVKNERARRSSATGLNNKSNISIHENKKSQENTNDIIQPQKSNEIETREVQNEEDIFSCWEQEKSGEGLIWQDQSQLSDLKLNTLISENLDDINQMSNTVIRVDQILHYQIKSESKISLDKSQQDNQINVNQESNIISPIDILIQQQDIYEYQEIPKQKIFMEYVDTHKNGSHNTQNNNWSQFLKLDGIDFQMQENQNIMRDFNKSAKVQSLLLSPRKESMANKSNKNNKVKNKLISECKNNNIQNEDQPYCSKSSHSSDKQTCSMFEEQNNQEDQTVVKQNQVSKQSILSSINNPTVIQKIEDFKKQLFFIQPFNELLPYSDNQLSVRSSQNLNSGRKNVNLTPKNQEIDQIIMKQINDSAKINQCTPLQFPIVEQIQNICYENSLQKMPIQNEIDFQNKFDVTEETSDNETLMDNNYQQNNIELVSNIMQQKSNSSDKSNISQLNETELDKFRKINTAKKNIRNIQLLINTDINDYQYEKQLNDEIIDSKLESYNLNSDFNEPSNVNQVINCNLSSDQKQASPLSQNYSICQTSAGSKKQIYQQIEQNQVLANDYVMSLLDKIDSILQSRVLQIKNCQGSGKISDSEHDREIQSFHQDYQYYDSIQSQLKENVRQEFGCILQSQSSEKISFIEQQVDKQEEIQQASQTFRSPHPNMKKNFVSLNSASSSSYTKYIEKNQENKKFRQSQQQYIFTLKGNNQIIQSSYEDNSSCDKISQTQSHFLNNPRLIEVNSNECLNDEIVLLNPKKLGPVYNSEGGDCLKQNQSLQDYLFSPNELRGDGLYEKYKQIFVKLELRQFKLEVRAFK